MTNPLYFTGISEEGKLLVGGAFKFKDQEGVPLDLLFEMCKEEDLTIDYCELLCNAWLNDCLKFDSICRELELLSNLNLKEQWKQLGMRWILNHPKVLKHSNPIDIFCKYTISLKKLSHKNLDKLLQ